MKTNLRIALFLAGIISAGMAAETVAEESKSTLYAFVHIYEVKSEPPREFRRLVCLSQAAMADPASC